jgi:orotate phosphoribosyltransferase
MISLKDFEETGALLTGHFQLSSGLHSDRYLQCARLLMWPPRAEQAGRALAERLSEFSPAAVVSPALGGIVIGHETARALRVPFLFAERREGAFLLRRGFRLDADEPVVVVEDVLTTGRSTREVIETVASSRARVRAVGAIVDRGLPEGALPVPVRSLLSVRASAWPESECPLCRAGVPVETPGSRFAGHET